MSRARITRTLVLVGLASVAAIGFVVACSSSDPGSSSGTTPSQESGTSDAPADTGVVTDAGGGGTLDGRCADKFGTGLTEGFGRIDGVVYAIQKPGDESCAMPNRDHVVLQVLMKGDVYRMVVNVESDRGGDTKIRIATVPHALPAIDFEEGWHTGIPLDYPQILGVHTDAGFSALTLAEAVTRIQSEVKVGDPVAVYGTSGPGRPESTHLIHRNTTEPNQDGAIVIHPDGANPKFMLFHFADQSF